MYPIMLLSVCKSCVALAMQPPTPVIMFVAGVCTNPLLFHRRKKYRVLIYNGDVDACVPYLGNEVSGCGGAGDDTWL